MPRLLQDDETMMALGGTTSFQFSGKRVEHLGATEYTLATIAVDLTGSVDDFAAGLRDALVASVGACKKSPRANNLLLRVVFFNSSIGIYEQHGFKPLGEIDVDEYPEFENYRTPAPERRDRNGNVIKPMRIYGSTNLFDTEFATVGATNAYAKILMDQQFLANGIVIVVTDGDNNSSSATESMVKSEIEQAAKAETIESMITILVGINATACSAILKKHAAAVGMQYLDAGDATPGKLAKLASFVSQSISSQSQSLGTGGPSMNIAAVI